MAMNAREGFRRIALVTGIIGACLGIFASSLYWPSFNSRRHQHNMFVYLAGTDEAQDDIKVVDGYHMVSTEFTPELPSKYGIKKINYMQSPDGKHDLVASFEMEDGTVYYRWVIPYFWEYMLLPGFPLIGFFLPMGVFKALFWIIAGFQKGI